MMRRVGHRHPEAHLVINAARTVFAFLDAKLSGTAAGPEATKLNNSIDLAATVGSNRSGR